MTTNEGVSRLRHLRSGDAEFPLLLGPAMWKRVGEPGHGEIGWRTAVGDGFDKARRQRFLMWGSTLPSRRAISSNELALPSLRSFIQERARAMAVSKTSLVAGSRLACAEGFQAMPLRADALAGIHGSCSVISVVEPATAVPCPTGAGAAVG